MRLLCVIADLGSGGAERQLVCVGRELKRRGHWVEFFLYYPARFYGRLLDEVGIPVHRRIKQHRWSVRPALELRRLILRERFTAVLAFLSTPSFYAELATVGLRGVRLVVSERSVVPDQKATCRLRLLALAHLRAQAVVVNSHTHWGWLAAHFPWLRERLHVIYNGVDLNDFRPTDVTPRRKGSELRLLGAGRITRGKNQLALVRALALCNASYGPRVSVDWAGRVEDEQYFRECTSAISKGDLGGVWSWIGPRSDMPDLMRSYDALILPSLWEGLPNVVCEAMASGLPVLASHVCDNRLLLEPARAGLLFRPDDPADIARAIVQYAGLEAEERQAMGQRARQYAEERLSIQRCAAEFERLLDLQWLDSPRG